MKFYTKQHRFYCGIDLHASAMFVCVLDSTGEVVLHKNIPTRPKAFLCLIKPYREDLVVGCECMFTWYWLADLCANEEIDFVLGHALYMRAIHGGKAKNDKIDSHKIAVLLRGGSFPVAYTYPKKMRALIPGTPYCANSGDTILISQVSARRANSGDTILISQVSARAFSFSSLIPGTPYSLARFRPGLFPFQIAAKRLSQIG